MYYLQPRSQEDLRRRNRAHRKIADFCFGLMGRTPDAFAGNLTGLSMKPEVFDSEPGGNRDQSAGDLPACAAQRPVRHLCDRAAAGRAQQGLLPVQGTAAAGAAGDRGGRQGRHAQRHEDAGERRRLRARGADRQRDAARARSAQGIDHLRDPAQSARPNALVARAVQPAGHELVRSSAHHALR